VWRGRPRPRTAESIEIAGRHHPTEAAPVFAVFEGRGFRLRLPWGFDLLRCRENHPESHSEPSSSPAKAHSPRLAHVPPTIIPKAALPKSTCLLNKIARGIEDAWTAGLIQLFVIAVLSYGVASGVVNDFDTARMQAEVACPQPAGGGGVSKAMEVPFVLVETRARGDLLATVVFLPFLRATPRARLRRACRKKTRSSVDLGSARNVAGVLRERS
jgi:hypothetical protein